MALVYSSLFMAIENVLFMVKGISKALKNNMKDILRNPHEIVE